MRGIGSWWHLAQERRMTIVIVSVVMSRRHVVRRGIHPAIDFL